jgi:hypothetical protein
MRSDGWMDVTKLIVAFGNFTEAQSYTANPHNVFSYLLCGLNSAA